MTYWSNVDRRPGRPISSPVSRDMRPARRLSPRDFDRDPPFRKVDEDRDYRETEGPRAALVPLLLLIIILGAVLAYGLTRPGAIARLLPGFTETAVTPASTATEPVAQPSLPDMPGLAILIRNAIVALHQANATGNYSVLRDIGSPRFQGANTPASLSDAFSDLRRRNLDLGAVAAVSPRLSRQPIIDKAGMLYLSGDFAAASGQVDFELVFEMIGSRWRLFGVGVKPTGKNEARLMPADKTALPDPAALLALIRGQIIALNQATLTGNYSVLRDMAAPGFREANSSEKLSSIFAVLSDRQIDLGPVAVIDPKLLRPAAVGQDGILRLTGFFPSQTERVNFDMAFENIEGEWKLFGIGLNTSPEVAAAPPPARVIPEPVGSGGGGADIFTPAPGMTPPLPRPRPQS